MIDMKPDPNRSAANEAGRIHRFGRIRIALGQYIGEPDCPFMRRWMILHDNGVAIRLHNFLPNHYESVAHDHPFWFITLVLRGGYIDITDDKYDKMRVGSIRFRSARHTHKTVTDERGAWTLIINGPKTRMWGFVDAVKGWVPWVHYKGKRAACEDPFEEEVHSKPPRPFKVSAEGDADW